MSIDWNWQDLIFTVVGAVIGWLTRTFTPSKKG